MLRQWALRQSNDSQILLPVLQETASDVVRIKPKESAQVLKSKQPVIIGAEKPLPDFCEMPSPAPRIGTKILYVAADRVFQNRQHQQHLGFTTRPASVDLKIFV